jgi:hypothetical protein
MTTLLSETIHYKAKGEQATTFLELGDCALIAMQACGVISSRCTVTRPAQTAAGASC